MATAEDLRQQINATQRELEGEHDLTVQLNQEITEANERQRLRRVLESLQDQVRERKHLNADKRLEREYIDDDDLGEHMPEDDDLFMRRPIARCPEGLESGRHEEVWNCGARVSAGEYVWKIEGFSWLANYLQQSGMRWAESEEFNVGTHEFSVVYHPKGGYIYPGLGRSYQSGSLAVVHQLAGSLTFRYRFFVRQKSGEFVQWGDQGDECHPLPANTQGWAFGPDVQIVNSGVPSRRIGIFGMSYENLLQSDSVVDDTVTVKIELEVLPNTPWEPSAGLVRRAHVHVPPSTISTQMRSALDTGENSDITFIVQGQSCKAHSQILSARSEVLDKQLHSGMRESVSREIIVDDCDVATFKAFLQYLYTDDFSCMEEMVKAQCTEKNESEAGGSAAVSSMRMSLLQGVLALSHKYEVSRLQAWAAEQLCRCITHKDVCSVLCQAHLYESRTLEEVCLHYIKDNKDAVMMTPEFSALSSEWPPVMVKVTMFLAGLSGSRAQAALEAQQNGGRTALGKRKRGE
mmetsp:Transcript_44391/g.82555  ORF Transcript_44391/g.82555 Transcript_44391/m.82555 type:complete len:519 (+) Transcript_44391:79-1635(+)